VHFFENPPQKNTTLLNPCDILYFSIELSNKNKKRYIWVVESHERGSRGHGCIDLPRIYFGMPMIGRWAGVDPIAAQFPHVSVFNYAENEPVGYIDL